MRSFSWKYSSGDFIPSMTHSPAVGVKSMAAKTGGNDGKRKARARSFDFIPRLENQIPALLLKVAGEVEITGWRLRLKVAVEIKILRRRAVDVVVIVPFSFRLGAVINFHERAVIGESFTGPVLQQTNEVFCASAVGAAP